ncbi:hypothetical protein ACIZ62_12995 [Acetobacterium carbinolicum]|uniref:hypothetical protein n=1 Tax=Acetobacterium carbinolicum TaxID=52690 RepID=UPI0039BF5157
MLEIKVNKCDVEILGVGSGVDLTVELLTAIDSFYQEVIHDSLPREVFVNMLAVALIQAPAHYEKMQKDMELNRNKVKQARQEVKENAGS